MKSWKLWLTLILLLAVVAGAISLWKYEYVFAKQIRGEIIALERTAESSVMLEQQQQEDDAPKAAPLASPAPQVSPSPASPPSSPSAMTGGNAAPSGAADSDAPTAQGADNGRGARPDGAVSTRRTHSRVPYSFALAIRDFETRQIYTSNSDDRSWALVRRGQCAEVRLFRYPFWDLERRGTFFGARLIAIFDCPEK